jgi:hypothetical protein
MLLTFVCLCITIVAIQLIERLALPRSGQRRLLRRVRLLAVMPVVVFFATVFMITYRPILSMVATIIAFSIVVVINNAKFRVLKEPLVYSDFSLLREAIRHPALYVRYIGVAKLTLCALASIAAIALGISLEPPVVQRPDPDDYFPTLIYLAIVIGMIYAVTRGPLRPPLIKFLKQFGSTADPRTDMDKLSLVACLVVYFFLAGQPPAKKKKRKRTKTSHQTAEAKPALPVIAAPPYPDLQRPDIVVIQAESFFDARRLNQAIPRELLSHLDEICNEANYYGRLTVPAWGANTMRTEFEFLSGLPNETLGYDRFNPYLSLGKRPVWTIAHTLRLLGYRTICIHPFEAKFFDRDIVFPNLGFDRFIDVTEFNNAQRFGPYISDLAVAAKIESLLNENNEPQFIFAITMENHGKWEIGRLQTTLPDSASLSPLELYLRHLANTNKVILKLRDHLQRHPREAVFCLYGDHVPSLPADFERNGYTDERTDYFIWRRGSKGGQNLNTTSDVLHRLVLKTALTPA